MGSLMEARRRILLSSPHKETIQNADIASFSTDMRSPLRSLRIGIDPVQDLHGYDSPWPAGGGKNLADIDSWTDGFLSATGTSITTPSDAGNLVSGFIPVEEGVRYTYSTPTLVINPNLSPSFQAKWTGYAFYESADLSTVVRQRIVNSQESFSFVVPENAKYLVVGSRHLQNGGKVQLEKGSTATSYAPYSNLCPISGWDAANLWRTGKNLLDPDKRTQTSNNIRYYVADGFLLKSGQTYTLSISGPPANGLYFVRMSDNSNIAVKYSNTKLTYTPTEDVLVKFNIYYAPAPSGGLDDIKCQLELSSTPTPYAPYTGNQFTIQLGQTVYGGTLDVIGGNLRVLYEKLTVNGSANWKTERNYFYYTTGVYSPPSYPLTPQVVCNLYPVVPITGTETVTGAYLTAGGEGTSGYLRVRDLSLTLDQFKAMLNETPIEYVHPLLTPITIPLTPQEISTLAGQNVMWGDSGKIELLKYWTHK